MAFSFSFCVFRFNLIGWPTISLQGGQPHNSHRPGTQTQCKFCMGSTFVQRGWTGRRQLKISCFFAISNLVQGISHLLLHVLRHVTHVGNVRAWVADWSILFKCSVQPLTRNIERKRNKMFFRCWCCSVCSDLPDLFSTTFTTWIKSQKLWLFNIHFKNFLWE